MKKIYTLLMLLLPLSMIAQTNYSGNTGAGFGGSIGSSTLTVSDNATTVTFSIAAASSFSGNNVVFYIDNGAGGGYASTSTFTDVADAGRRTISGFSNPDRTTVNFPTGFKPQLAISVDYGFAGLFSLTNPANFTFLNGGGLGVVGNTLTFTFLKSNLGLTGTSGFKFFATLISPTAFRSNEAIGSALPNGTADGAGNYGFNQAINPATFAVYTSALPLSILNLSGSKTNGLTQLKFVTSDETSVTSYTIQASANKLSWTTIATQNSRSNNNGSEYVHSDNRNVKGSQYYRIRAQDIDGSFKFSNTLLLKGSGGASVQLLGNIVNSQIKYALSDNESKKVQVSLISSEGRVVGNSTVQHLGGYATYTLNTGNLASGMYFIQFRSADGNVQTEKFIKQ